MIEGNLIITKDGKSFRISIDFHGKVEVSFFEPIVLTRNELDNLNSLTKDIETYIRNNMWF